MKKRTAKTKAQKRIRQMMGKGYFKGRKRQRGKKNQKGGFGAGLAMGMLAPQLLGTLSNILKINV